MYFKVRSMYNSLNVDSALVEDCLLAYFNGVEWDDVPW